MGYARSSTSETPGYTSVLQDNERMVDHLARARREERAEIRHEKKIDQCAEFFLILCGYADYPFSITAEGANFKIFGKTCYSAGDH